MREQRCWWDSRARWRQQKQRTRKQSSQSARTPETSKISFAALTLLLIPYFNRKTISRYDCKRATKRTTILFVTHCDKRKGLPSVIERGDELTLDQAGSVGVLTRGVEILTIHECSSSTLCLWVRLRWFPELQPLRFNRSFENAMERKLQRLRALLPGE